MAVAHGGLMGWFSPAIVELKKPGMLLKSAFLIRLIVQFFVIKFKTSVESPIGVLTLEAQAWLGSISYIGGFIGTFFFMIITKWLGRKNTFLILPIPNIVHFSLL